jgi:hypothetical protein
MATGRSRYLSRAGRWTDSIPFPAEGAGTP